MRYTVNIARLLFALIYAAFLIGASNTYSLAVEDQYELYPSIGTKDKDYEQAKSSSGPEKRDIFDYDISSSFTVGYDTNVYLDHYDESESIFLQNTLDIETGTQLFERCVLRLGYNMTYIEYLKFAEPDLFDNIFNVGIDTELNDTLIWSVDYILDFVGYPHDDSGEHSINELETALTHIINNDLYHKLSYRYSKKEYSKWKIRNRTGTIQSSDREDSRDTFEYELGYYLTDKTFLKAENTIYLNDSNEAYLDYYDFWTVGTKLTAIHLFTDKLYSLMSTGYQHKSYNNRIVSDQDRGDQRDNLLSAGTSIFYDLNKNLSLGTNFNYRKNFSNENNQKYTDYIISGGLYYKY